MNYWWLGMTVLYGLIGAALAFFTNERRPEWSRWVKLGAYLLFIPFWLPLTFWIYLQVRREM